jgi:hypothetical protein
VDSTNSYQKKLSTKELLSKIDTTNLSSADWLLLVFMWPVLAAQDIAGERNSKIPKPELHEFKFTHKMGEWE